MTDPFVLDLPLAITVLLATFNGEGFLMELLASLAAQSTLPFELIVGDDGSTDATLALLGAFATTAPFPVRIIRRPHRLGASENFMSLIGLVRSRYIAFADQDDIWLSTKLERIGQSFEHGVSLVMHQASLIDEAGQTIPGRFPEIPRSVIRGPMDVDPWFPTYGMAMAVDRVALDAVAALDRPPSRDLDDHVIDHDEWAFFVGSAVGSTAMLAEPLTRYRQHPGNYVGAPRFRSIDRITRGLLHDDASYRQRQRLAETYATFWERAASSDTDLSVPLCLAAAARYRHLASRLGSRADALDPATPVGRRFRTFLALVWVGGYARRRRGGLGGRALVGDALRIAIPRARMSRRPVPEAVAHRITAERRSGRTIELIAHDLGVDHVPPPYGRSWRPAMVRDVLLDTSIADELAGIADDAGGAPRPVA